MGHSDISVTYNTYTHLGFEDVRGDMLRMTMVPRKLKCTKL